MWENICSIKGYNNCCFPTFFGVKNGRNPEIQLKLNFAPWTIEIRSTMICFDMHLSVFEYWLKLKLTRNIYWFLTNNSPKIEFPHISQPIHWLWHISENSKHCQHCHLKQTVAMAPHWKSNTWPSSKPAFDQNSLEIRPIEFADCTRHLFAYRFFPEFWRCDRLSACALWQNKNKSSRNRTKHSEIVIVWKLVVHSLERDHF